MPLSVKLFLSANIGLYPSGDCFILNGEKHLPPFRLMQVLLSTMNEKYQIADKLSSMELRYAFIRQKLEAGVDMFVAGSAVFGAPDIVQRVKEFQAIIKR